MSRRKDELTEEVEPTIDLPKPVKNPDIQKNYDPDWDYQYFTDLMRVYIDREKMFESYFSENTNEWLLTGLIFVMEENGYEGSNNKAYSNLKLLYEKSKGNI